MGLRVLVLVGPTASGKTAVSIQLAHMLRAEILSADSRQIYRFMDIGTAKPTPEQRRQCPHHFIDERDPDQEFSAGEFGTAGRERITEIAARGNVPMVVGGSGLYVQSLIDGFFEGPGADQEYREILTRRLESGGAGALLEELRRVDPESAERIEPSKPRRIMRALEVYHQAGVPMSALHRQSRPVIPFRPVLVGLRLAREELYARIEKRCEQMLADGLVDEVRRLQSLGYRDSLNALNTVGYAEVFGFLRGETSREEMLRLFRQNTRRYAKRQMTWFRRDSRISWIDADSHSHQAIAERVVEAFGTGG